MEPSGAYRHAHYSDCPFFHPMDAIRHNRDISRAWTLFILDKSEGFTKAGVERLNDSIRTFVWAILGAQAQTRSNILKTGTGFDAQKQFLANVEDAIASPVDIPSSIARYQKTLQYASTPLDYVFGIGLYIIPSDMALHPGNVQGYNNEIVIAGSETAIGHNPGINESEQKSKATVDNKEPPSGRPGGSPSPAAAPVVDSAGLQQPASSAAATSHKEVKTALIAAGVGSAYWRFGCRRDSQSLAATRRRVPTLITKAHKFSASHEGAFLSVLMSEETMDLMIPGRAAAAAKLARPRPRACRCLFTHSLTPPLSGGLGRVARAHFPHR